VGITGGYVEQTGMLQATGDKLKVAGYNVGAYARIHSNGFYANLLAKYDAYDVSFTFAPPASPAKFGGTTWGVDFRTGYRFVVGGAFVEPSASIAYTQTSLDGFTGVNSTNASYNKGTSAYGQVGLRAGLPTSENSQKLAPFVGAYYAGDLAPGNRATLTSGGSALPFQDDRGAGHARFEAGVTGNVSKGLSYYGLVDGSAGSTSGVGGRVGLRWQW
jgi:outer membrane autotransporter protein